MDDDRGYYVACRVDDGEEKNESFAVTQASVSYVRDGGMEAPDGYDPWGGDARSDEAVGMPPGGGARARPSSIIFIGNA
jgi:hypothetical protein